MSSWPPSPEQNSELFKEFSEHAAELVGLIRLLQEKIGEWKLGADYARLVTMALIFVAENSRPQSITEANQALAIINSLFPDLTQSIYQPNQSHDLAQQILDKRDAIEKSIRRPKSFGGIAPGFEASARVGAKNARRGRSE